MALAGCSSGPATPLAETSSAISSSTAATEPAVDDALTPGGLVAPPGASLVATARGPKLTILDAAGGEPMSTLDNPIPTGGPRTLLVLDTEEGWLHVALPGRPNGRSGWVRESDVDVAATQWRLVISESAHRLDVFESGKRVKQYPVGVGKSATPTVRGTFFVTELLKPPNPDGDYGPYAFGLSAYSEVLTSFGSGDGQLGLHGTNEPELVGTNVSHGCLRVTNTVITELAKTIPLGTPIEIRP